MVDDFGIGLFMVALVSILQHLAIAKFYTRKNDLFFETFQDKYPYKYS